MVFKILYHPNATARFFTIIMCGWGLLSFSQNHFTKAKEYFHQNKFEPCLAYLDSCDQLKLYSDSVLCLRAYIALKSNDPDKATVYCNSLQIENRNYHELMFLRALISSLKKKYALAAEQFTKFLHHEPNNVKALYDRAWAKGNLEDFESAIEDLDRCVKLDSSLIAAYYLRGYWHEALGNYDEAFDDYSKTIALNPDYKEAYVPLAFVLNKKGDKHRACDMLNIAIEKGVVSANELKENYCK